MKVKMTTHIVIASTKRMLVEAVAGLLSERCNDFIFSILESLEDDSKFPQLNRGDIIILTEPGFRCSTVCALQKIQSLSRGTPVVLITCKGDVDRPSFLFQHSVTAILTRECQASDLYAALKMAACGRPYVIPTVAQALAKDFYDGRQKIKLSPRQIEVIGFIARGSRTSEIAERLSLTAKTISAHKCSIKTRLNVRSTSEIVQYAIEHNLAIS
jgi:two-component system invasion response regulator UvrY